jgi:hypothetical protein
MTEIFSEPYQYLLVENKPLLNDLFQDTELSPSLGENFFWPLPAVIAH